MQIIKIIFRNTFRHKLRTTLTILAVAIAIFSFGFLRTVIDAWYAGVEVASVSRLITRSAISLVVPLPLSYKEKIKQIKGIKQVAIGSWFGGIYIEGKNFFANFAVDPKEYLDIYSEIILSDAQKSAFLKDKKSFIAGKRLADKYGWKIGDIVTLKGTIYPGNWDFVMKGIYRGRDKNVDETVFAFHWDYINESLKKTSPERADKVGWYFIEAQDPEVVADVAKRIDETFKNSMSETLTETEKAFQMSFVTMTEAILMAINAVSFIVIIIIMAVTANTMAMTSRERIGEYSIFKTLGFKWYYIVFLILGESFFIVLTGSIIGIAATFPAVEWFHNSFSTYFPIFNISTKTIWLDIVSGITISFVAAIVPTIKAIRINIADGLRIMRFR